MKECLVTWVHKTSFKFIQNKLKETEEMIFTIYYVKNTVNIQNQITFTQFIKKMKFDHKGYYIQLKCWEI